MADRLSCCVPYCRRSTAREKIAPDHNEWLCQKHWKLVPTRLKRRRAKLRNIAKRTNDFFRLAKVNELDGLLWADCKREAIERAAGI